MQILLNQPSYERDMFGSSPPLLLATPSVLDSIGKV